MCPSVPEELPGYRDCDNRSVLGLEGDSWFRDDVRGGYDDHVIKDLSEETTKDVFINN